MLIKKIKFLERKMIIDRDNTSPIEVKYFEYPILREKIAHIITSFVKEQPLYKHAEESEIYNKSIFEIIELIDYLEIENSMIDIKLKTEELFSCKLTESLEAPYSHILSYLKEIDFPEDKLNNFIRDLKNLIQCGREDRLLRKSLEENMDGFLRMLKNIWEDSVIYSEDIDELWASLLDIRTEILQTKKELYRENDFIIENITLLKENMTINLSDKNHSMVYPEDILQVLKNLKKLLTGLIHKNYLRILDNKKPVCHICGECCRIFTIEIEPSDINCLSQDPDIAEEIKDYLETGRYSWNNGSKILKKSFDKKTGQEQCVFLKYNEKDKYYCSVHRFKPALCRRYEPGKPHCYKNNNFNHRVNFRNINIDGENIFIQTEYTEERMKYPFLIKWQENEILKEEIEKLINLVILRMKKNYGR
jgi:Fe-S-cluster containining protein